MSPDETGAGVAARLARVRDRVRAAEVVAGRAPGSVRLLLATKTVPVKAVRAALRADAAARALPMDHSPGDGPVEPVLIGENRVQELVAKAPDLADLAPDLHLIGPLQSNKVNAALRWATCLESIDTLELAVRVADRCRQSDRVLDVYVQVNVSGETTKHGVPPVHAAQLALDVAALEGVRLRGFMTVGARSPDAATVRAGYALLAAVRAEVLASGAPGTARATELSMGMSGDLELAIAEGATIVRTGTAVFGSRLG